MLRILCNKYGITQDRMQFFLDRARFSVTSNQSLLSQYLKTAEVSNPFIFHQKDSSNNSNGSLESDEVEVDWDLNNVHIPTVVNSFYQTYCLGKTPKQSEIEKVPASESASFLLQLCYNFNVRPELINPLIEAARRNGQSSTPLNSSSGVNNINMNGRSRSNSQQRNLRNSNGDDASSVGSMANSLSSTGRHRAPPPPPPPPSVQLNPSGSKPPVPVANFIEVPQSVFNPSRKPSFQLGDGEHQHSKTVDMPQSISQSRSNSIFEQPNVLTEEKSVIHAVRIEESLRSEVDSGSSVPLQWKTSDFLFASGNESHQRKPSTIKVKLHGGDGDQPTVTQVFSEASSEIEKMKSELEITRQQLKEVCMESKEVLRILKDNSTELERSKSATRRTTELLMPEGAVATDSSNEKGLEYYKKCDLLVAQNDLLQRRNEELSVALHSARATLDDALSDRRDLLELIDVVSSAANNGINFNSILDAYLAKLGLPAADINTLGRANGNQFGPKKTIGTKIADALEWKRSQIIRNAALPRSPNVDGLLLASPPQFARPHLSEPPQEDGNDDESEEVKNPLDASRFNMGSFATKSASNGIMVSDGNISSHSKGGEYFKSSQDDAASERIDLQYDLARKAHLHAVSHAKLAAQLATQNLTMQKGMNAEKLGSTRIARSFSPASTKVASNENVLSSSKLGSASSDHHYQQQLRRQQQTPEEMAADWKECFDPRTNRKYYYSPSLKKSLWTDPTKPSSRNGTPKAASSSRNTSPKATGGDNSRAKPGRAGAGAGTLTRSNSSDFLTRSNNSSRNNSPALSATGAPKRGDGIPSGTNDNPRDVWVMALDAKSNRYYWYNRQTKTSTWRKPALP